MDSLKNGDTWLEIALWLNARQLAQLLLSGDQWMTAVLTSSRLSTITGKFYPLLSIIPAVQQWEIPEFLPLSPTDKAVTGPFPAQLRSLSVTPDFRAVTDEVILPRSLTSLTVGGTAKGRHQAGWRAWSTAIKSLTQLQVLNIDADYTFPVVMGLYPTAYNLLDGSYPNLTSLTIGELGNATTTYRLSGMIPDSLTELKISHVNGVISDLEDIILSLTHLLVLTIPSHCLRKPDYHTLRNFPAHLRELVIYVTDTRHVVRGTVIPMEVVRTFPRSITLLNVLIEMADDEYVRVLELLPLRTLALTTAFGAVRGYSRNFEGTFPYLERLSLTEFSEMSIPPSVTSLVVDGMGRVSIVPDNRLRELVITLVTQIQSQERTAVYQTFSNLTSCMLDLRFVPADTFLTALNPAIIQSLTMQVWETTTALEVLRWVDANAHGIRHLKLYTGEALLGLNVQSEANTQEFYLPHSITDLTISFHTSAKLRLVHIPIYVVQLHLEGIKVDVSELSQLIQLEDFSIDTYAIIGPVWGPSEFGTNRQQLELEMLNFLLALPPQLTKASISNKMVMSSRPIGETVKYYLDEWLRKPCTDRDPRTVIPHIMLTLVSSYMKLPLTW